VENDLNTFGKFEAAKKGDLFILWVGVRVRVRDRVRFRDRDRD
jgi:hypothetical protein